MHRQFNLKKPSREEYSSQRLFAGKHSEEHCDLTRSWAKRTRVTHCTWPRHHSEEAQTCPRNGGGENLHPQTPIRSSAFFHSAQSHRIPAGASLRGDPAAAAAHLRRGAGQGVSPGVSVSGGLGEGLPAPPRTGRRMSGRGEQRVVLKTGVEGHPSTGISQGSPLGRGPLGGTSGGPKGGRGPTLVPPWRGVFLIFDSLPTKF